MAASGPGWVAGKDAAGHDARGVRDVGLQGSPDLDVHAFAITNGLVLVTADLGLADPFRYPPEYGTVPRAKHVTALLAECFERPTKTGLNRPNLSALVPRSLRSTCWRTRRPTCRSSN